MKSRFAEAEPLLREAVRITAARGDSGTLPFLNAVITLNALHRMTGDYVAAERLSKQACEAARASFGEQASDLRGNAERAGDGKHGTEAIRPGGARVSAGDRRSIVPSLAIRARHTHGSQQPGHRVRQRARSGRRVESMRARRNFARIRRPRPLQLCAERSEPCGLLPGCRGLLAPPSPCTARRWSASAGHPVATLRSRQTCFARWPRYWWPAAAPLKRWNPPEKAGVRTPATAAGLRFRDRSAAGCVYQRRRDQCRHLPFAQQRATV